MNVRERKELENLFADPKYARQAWKSVGQAIALQPATKPVIVADKNGNDSADSLLECYSYNKLCNDIKKLAHEDREPTEIEMILHCQMVKARTDTSAAIFIRDTLGAKPVDESKMDATVNNPFEQLSDEELELIQKEREKKALAQQTIEQLEQKSDIIEINNVDEQQSN